MTDTMHEPTTTSAGQTDRERFSAILAVQHAAFLRLFRPARLAAR